MKWLLASRLEDGLTQNQSTEASGLSSGRAHVRRGLVERLFVPALGREGEALARCSRRGDAVNYPMLVLTSETLSPQTTSLTHTHTHAHVHTHSTLHGN